MLSALRQSSSSRRNTSETRGNLTKRRRFSHATADAEDRGAENDKRLCYDGRKPARLLPTEKGGLKPVKSWTRTELITWAKSVPSLASDDSQARVVNWWEHWCQQPQRDLEEWESVYFLRNCSDPKEYKHRSPWFYDTPVSDRAETERLWAAVDAYCKWSGLDVFSSDVAEIVPGLWISGERASKNLLFRHVHDIRMVIGLNGSRDPQSRECQTVSTVWQEQWRYNREEVKQLLLTTLDMLWLLHENHSTGKNVLVHCAGGENRSSLLIDYLAMTGYSHMEIIRLLRETNKRRERAVAYNMAARELILLLARNYQYYGYFYPFGMVHNAISDLEKRYSKTKHFWGIVKQRRIEDIDVDDGVTERNSYAGTKEMYWEESASDIEPFLSPEKLLELKERRKKEPFLNTQ